MNEKKDDIRNIKWISTSPRTVAVTGLVNYIPIFTLKSRVDFFNKVLDMYLKTQKYYEATIHISPISYLKLRYEPDTDLKENMLYFDLYEYDGFKEKSIVYVSTLEAPFRSDIENDLFLKLLVLYDNYFDYNIFEILSFLQDTNVSSKEEKLSKIQGLTSKSSFHYALKGIIRSYKIIYKQEKQFNKALSNNPKNSKMSFDGKTFYLGFFENIDQFYNKIGSTKNAITPKTFNNDIKTLMFFVNKNTDVRYFIRVDHETNSDEGIYNSLGKQLSYEDIKSNKDMFSFFREQNLYNLLLYLYPDFLYGLDRLELSEESIASSFKRKIDTDIVENPCVRENFYLCYRILVELVNNTKRLDKGLFMGEHVLECLDADPYYIFNASTLLKQIYLEYRYDYEFSYKPMCNYIPYFTGGHFCISHPSDDKDVKKYRRPSPDEIHGSYCCIHEDEYGDHFKFILREGFPIEFYSGDPVEDTKVVSSLKYLVLKDFMKTSSYSEVAPSYIGLFNSYYNLFTQSDVIYKQLPDCDERYTRQNIDCYPSFMGYYILTLLNKSYINDRIGYDHLLNINETVRNVGRNAHCLDENMLDFFLKNFSEIYIDMPERLKNDEDVCRKVLRYGTLDINHINIVNEELRNCYYSDYVEGMKVRVKNNPDLFKQIDQDIKDMFEVQNIVLKKYPLILVIDTTNEKPNYKMHNSIKQKLKERGVKFAFLSKNIK